MVANNEHIVEVLCAMWFDSDPNEWDSTFFGKYYTEISQLGYTEKEEQKGFEFKIEIKPKPVPEYTEGKSRMIFRNPTQKTAIILSDNFISFHKLAPYDTWEKLIAQVVEPGFEKYKKIGLGNHLREVQCLYLNKHTLGVEQSIASVFKFWPSIEEGFETNILFQTKYDMREGVSVQLKLNGGANEAGVRDLFFECTTFVKATAEKDYHRFAEIAHEYANKVYNKLMK